MIFVHEGSGVLQTCYGELVWVRRLPGIPRGCIYQIHFDTDENRLFIRVAFPFRYPNG